MNHRTIVNDCLNGDFENYEPQEIIDVLIAADDLYYNDEESFMSDGEYDAIRKIAQKLDPKNTYFLGVGSSVRGGKIKLPFEMGSLDQIEIGDIVDWIKDWLLSNETMIASDKLDGVSCAVIYNQKGQQQIAYSRGDGVEGADISRHLFKVKDLPKKVSKGMSIRAEVILSESAFKKLQPLVMSRSGKPYKNARNMVSGLMNAKENDPIVYDYLSVVAYQILGNEGSKTDQLLLLRKEGFNTVDWVPFDGKEITDKMLAKYLNERRSRSEYALDGLVLDVDSAAKRKEMNPRRDTLNPAYSIKYKVADASNLARTKVLNVEWNPSKHGYLKPRIQIEPVQLVGVTVSNTNGFNGKFILENNIGPGTVIEITRSGDVIPYITKVISSTKAQMPDVEYTWTLNDQGEQVNCVMKDAITLEEVQVKQVTDFFASIDAPHLKSGTVQNMFELNQYHDAVHAIKSMIHYNEQHWVSCVGANGTKIYNGLRAKLKDIPLWKLAGALPIFGRGIGRRKIKKLQTALGFERLINGSFTLGEVMNVEGFDEKTAAPVIQNWNEFLTFIATTDTVVSLADDLSNLGSSMSGQKVVFTGFRDKDLEQAVLDAGGEMQSAVSSKTTILVAKDPNSGSGKVKKAAEKGVKVIGIDDLKAMVA